MKFVQPAVLALAIAFGATSAVAADPAPAKTLTPQQQKMRDCSAQATAKGLKGKEYTAFRNNCLKADSNAATVAPVAAPAPAKPMTQQEKMKACNTEATAKGLKGKDYTNFRNTCLKGGSSAATAH